MNRLNEKQNEKGSVLVEVIAVIALLGVMGPLLFRQVMTRNEEVENINIASEMRTLKEAFSAYILTYKAQLLNLWSQETAAEDDCKKINKQNIEAFLPFGNDAYDYYNFYLCKNSDNFLQGYIVPIPGDSGPMPEDVGLKRAARIANLIGADAAICYKNGADYDINGVAGGWGLPDDYGWCDANDGSTVYLVTTGMDTYVPEVTYEDYSTGVVSLPDKLALQDLHAWNYFSVGSGPGCYTLHHNTTGHYDSENGFVANNDEIRDVNDSGCDPLFWVSSISGSDDKAKGEVYVKNNLRVGAWRTADGTQQQAIGLFRADTASGTAADTTYDETRSAGNKIVVYDNTGKEKITINGKGEIIAKGETSSSGTEETMKMTNQGLESSIKAKNAKKNSEENENYKVDPAYTSVMNDIKLDSRGGARLSDILPNYISRGIYEIGGGSSSSSSSAVPVPDCPEGYAAAVIVTPTMWKNKSTVSKEEVEAKLKTEEITVSQGATKIDPVKITMDEGQNLDVQNADFKITVSGHETAKLTDDNGAGQKWTIRFLKADADTNSTNTEDLRTDVKGLAQTFCVYDKGYNGSWSSSKKPDNLERPSH